MNAELYKIRNNSSNNIASDSEDESEGSVKDDEDDDEDEQTWKRRKPCVEAAAAAAATEAQLTLAHSKAFIDSASRYSDSRKSDQTLLRNSSKLNVWSNVLQQRSLVEDLHSVGVIRDRRLPTNDRGSESYEFPGWDKPRSSLNRGEDPNNIPIWRMDSQEIHRRLGRKRGRKERGKTMSVLAKNKRSFQVTAENTDEEIVKAIATILREPKEDLIAKTVLVLGKEKALDLLQMTEDIEKRDGMLTVDQSRRRTPGGVYLLLVRNDRDITKEQLDEIFGEDRRQQAEVRKEAIKVKRRTKASEKTVLQLQDMKMFPTREEIVLEEAKKMKSEQMEADDEKEPGELTDSDDNDAH